MAGTFGELVERWIATALPGWSPPAEVAAPWAEIHAAAPQLAETMVAYVAQIGVSMRPSTARAVDTDLRIFAGFLLSHDAALVGVADIERSHIEAFKLWQWAQPGTSGRLKPATFRRRLGQLRTFFLRIIEWDWNDAPARVPIFFGDVPKREQPLPRFLDDARFTQFMRALTAEPVIRRRVAVEVLARTGMRVGELCGLEADAVTLIGDSYGLRVPLGKLHNDRYVPLHPHLVELLALYRRTYGAHDHGRLLSGEQGVLNRYAVQRWITAIARWAGIGHVHPHQLRHTLATQAINRGMSIGAIAALLGHRSLDMTLRYARISNRVVADEYDAVSAKVEALYRDSALPAEAEGPNMRELREQVHHRLSATGGAGSRRSSTATSSRSASRAPTSLPTPRSHPSCCASATTRGPTSKRHGRRCSTSSWLASSRSSDWPLTAIIYISPVIARSASGARSARCSGHHGGVVASHNGLCAGAAWLPTAFVDRAHRSDHESRRRPD